MVCLSGLSQASLVSSQHWYQYQIVRMFTFLFSQSLSCRRTGGLSQSGVSKGLVWLMTGVASAPESLFGRVFVDAMGPIIRLARGSHARFDTLAMFLDPSFMLTTNTTAATRDPLPVRPRTQNGPAPAGGNGLRVFRESSKAQHGNEKSVPKDTPINPSS